jgi:hypothetical protein
VLVAIVVEAVVVVMWEAAVVVVQVGIEDQGFQTVVIPVAVVVPLIVQLRGLEKEQLEKKVWLEKIKLDQVFDRTQYLMMTVKIRLERISILL